MSTTPLLLDETSVQPETLSMAALTREINLQQKPSWLLVKLMNALEKKRQQRGLGWSRAWNKYGMTVFRTHLVKPEEDQAFLRQLDHWIVQLVGDAPLPYREFVIELLADSGRMNFIFYHNRTTESGEQFEGLTLSIGRRVASDASKRDRIDLILEDRRVDGAVDGRVDRLRLYVCPWSLYGPDRSHYLLDLAPLPLALAENIQGLYRENVAAYDQWKSVEERQWSHWSVRYIDYFGPRDFIPQGSSFI